MSAERQPPDLDCGGCRGLGSHQRTCKTQPGYLFAKWANEAKGLGDSVGPNEMAAANHLWAAAGLLAEEAKRRRAGSA